MAGIYVHVPFCKVKCGYCDFNSYENQDALTEPYFDALIEEMRYHGAAMETLDIESIYIGGGTPTYVDSSYILNVLEYILNNFRVSGNAEITLEANPGTITKSKLLDYVIAGVNRVSLGAQSMHDNVLKRLGRIHTREDLIKSVEAVHNARIQNINIDLMFGLPFVAEESGAMLELWEQSLEDVVELGVPHISCYALHLEKGTPLYRAVENGDYKQCEDEADRKMYGLARSFLKENGFRHYEISNFAKPGFESRHNILYWKEQEYVGVGAGAHSFLRKEAVNADRLLVHMQMHGAVPEGIGFGGIPVNKFRYGNIKDIAAYCVNIREKGKAYEEVAHISATEEMREYVMLGFRLLEGIDFQAFQAMFGAHIKDVFQAEFSRLEQKELVCFCGENVRLTEKGLDFANQVFMEFVG